MKTDGKHPRIEKKTSLGTFSPRPRSDWHASLRREVSLAHASSFRLGESLKRGIMLPPRSLT